MKTITGIFLFVSLTLFFVFCKKTPEDTKAPVIHSELNDTFPHNCDTLWLGETFAVKMKFSDDTELASFTIEIDHNFNMHTHPSLMSDCINDTIKTPVYPFYYIKNFQIPENLKEFTSNAIIWIPIEDCCGTPFDEGNYHFSVTLFDKEGLSVEKVQNVVIAKKL